MMQKIIKTLMLIGVTLAVSSCNCFKVKDDIRRIYSFEFSQCRCQTYSFRKARELDSPVPCEDYFQPIRKKYEKKCRKEKFSKRYPERCHVLLNEQYCDDLVGFSINSWAENITPKMRESIACFEDKGGKNGVSKCR